ncbi:MAG: hypothetical protein RIT26_1408 [Pseudomonadota bacterium]|jgi:peptidoglycan/LPS O-acetylase OafA/YrhL
MRPRHGGIDLLKVVCAQLIVLHHALVYAPPGLHLTQLWPHLSAFLMEPGRWVVHVFLVIGGYLSMQALDRSRGRSWWSLVWQRYLRLMPMFALSVAVTLLMGWWVRGQYAPDFVTPWPGWADLLAHLTLTFDWWGSPAISAGAWYVAIDFQLYVILALVALAFRQPELKTSGQWRVAWLVMVVPVATWVFSRQPALDAFAPYFLGSYGLGALVALTRKRPRERKLLWAVMFILALDLCLDWRDRQALALATAAGLCLWDMWRVECRMPLWVARANDLSYALFVGHFGMLIGLGAWWTAHGAGGPWAAFIYLWVAAGLAWVWAWVLQTLCSGSGAWLARYFATRPRWA